MQKMQGFTLAIFYMLAWLLNSRSAPIASSNNYKDDADPIYNVWLPMVESQPIYYVNGALGSDTNPGSQARPWKTIQKAADTLVAGDVVIVAAGNYSNQRVSITRSGNSSSRITYLAQGQVIMKGFTLVANYINIIGFEVANTNYRRWDYQTSAGIYIQGMNNIVENNYIHDASLEGIHLFADPGNPWITQNNIVRNNILYHNELIGIHVNGRNNIIEGNNISHTVQCHPTLTKVENHASDNNGKKCPKYPAVKGLDADGMRFFGQGHIFRKNIIHDIIVGDTINGVNVNVNPHIDCFQTYTDTYSETAQSIIFEQNYCENPSAGMQVFMLAGGANHLLIRNNIFKAPVGINSSINVDGGSDYLYVFNNVWANFPASGSQDYHAAIFLEDISHVMINNNIFYDQTFDTVTILGDTSNIEVDYNLAYNSNGTVPHCVQWGNHETCQPNPNHELWNVDPRFVDPLSGDFHLKATSPAIDSGDDLGDLVPDDFDGAVRPQGTGFDIGAFEFPVP
jgi:parallel beta-helix repeat protein